MLLMSGNYYYQTTTQFCSDRAITVQLLLINKMI